MLNYIKEEGIKDVKWKNGGYSWDRQLMTFYLFGIHMKENFFEIDL